MEHDIKDLLTTLDRLLDMKSQMDEDNIFYHRVDANIKNTLARIADYFIDVGVFDIRLFVNSK